MTAAIDGKGLLDAILADPSSDDLRLIYADWLEDEGQAERAEFVRVQIRIATLEAASGHPRTTPLALSCKCAVCEEAAPLRRRERSLLSEAANWWGWLADLYPLLGTHAIADLNRCSDDAAHGVRFRRGFVETVRCPLAAWNAHGPAIVRAHPVQRVELTDRKPLRIDSRLGVTPRVGWRVDDGGWATGDAEEDACLLPGAIFARLSAPENKLTLSANYPDGEAALLALSDALLTWAKLPEDDR